MNDHTAVRLHSQTPAGGFVYVLREPFGRVKIGMTQHIKRRFDQLNTASAYDLEIVIVLESENAPQVERYLHRHFAAKRARLEWFDLDTEDIAYIRQGSYLGAALKTPRLQPKPHLRARRVELDFASLTPAICATCLEKYPSRNAARVALWRKNNPADYEAQKAQQRARRAAARKG